RWHLGELDRGRLIGMRQADPGDPLVDAAVDDHVAAAVGADIVLVLAPPPGHVAAADDDRQQYHHRGGHDRPAPPAASPPAVRPRARTAVRSVPFSLATANARAGSSGSRSSAVSIGCGAVIGGRPCWS